MKCISFQCFAIFILCLAAANAVPDCDHGYSYPQPQVQLKVAPAVEAVSYTPGYSSYSAGPAVKYASVGPAVASYSQGPAIASYSQGPAYSAYSSGPAYSSVDYTPGVTYAKSSGIVLASQSPSAQYAHVAAAPAVSYGLTKTLVAPAPIVTKAYLPPVAKVRPYNHLRCHFLILTVYSSHFVPGDQHLLASRRLCCRSFG